MNFYHAPFLSTVSKLGPKIFQAQTKTKNAVEMKNVTIGVFEVPSVTTSNTFKFKNHDKLFEIYDNTAEKT